MNATTFRAVVTPRGLPPVAVEYPAAAAQPTAAAIKAAADKLGVPGFAEAPHVEHFRDGAADGPDAPPTPAFGPVRRVQVFTPAGEWAGSVLASVRAGGDRADVALAHDYPDLPIAAGWRLTGRGLDLTVAAAAGRNLTCGPGGEA